MDKISNLNLSATGVNKPEISIVLPCLNEEEALPFVIAKIRETLATHQLHAEIIVCNNGSTDRSAEVAHALGVQVIEETQRGYGRAYLTGFAHAQGRILIMGDADASYDFSLIPQLIAPLRDGSADFVTGSRYLTHGSQEIPFLHRYVGNPALTFLLNLLFRCHYTDVYCGLRAFHQSAYEKIKPISTGMEFNLELAINAALAQLKIREIPIRLLPRKGRSKINTFGDGWKSLRMMLLYCPNVLFLWPGIVLFLLGSLALGLPHFSWLTYHGRQFGVVTGFSGAMLCILGFEILNLGLHVRTYSWSRRFDAKNEFLRRFFSTFTLEKGLLLGLVMLCTGLGILGPLLYHWLQNDLLPLSQPEWLPVGTTLVMIGVEVIFASLFISSMSIEHSAKHSS